MIFLDRQLHVKRYTARSRSFVGIREIDIDRPISELQLNVDRNGLLEDCRHVLDTLEKRENEVTTPDGRRHLMRILPYRSAERVIDGVVVTFVDINELAEARRYAESIVDTAREAIIVLDEDLKVVSANRTFYRQFKVGPEQTQGRFLYDLGNRQWDIPKLRELLEEIVSEKNIIENFEVQHTFEDIGEKIMVLNARRLERGREAKKPLILLVIEDQTEKRTALRRLDKSETRYRRLVEELYSFIIGIDTGGRITFFNGFSEKVFGYSRDEVIGKPFVGTIVPPVDSYGTDSSKVMEQIFANPQQSYAVQSEGLCKDGRRIFFVWSAITVPGQGEQGIEILIDGNDITEAKKAQVELRQRAEELASANRDLESFSYSISHDLRNPLNALSSVVEILLEEYAERLDDEGRECVRHIDTGTKKMVRIIDGLLTLSRIGQQEIHREEIDLSAIVRDHLEEVRAADPERDVEAIVPNDVRAEADSRLMHLALENLVRNAWKFTAKKDHGRIEFGTFEKDGRIVYFIRDNGAGFESRFAETIFKPFERGHTEKQYAGTGIGLSIVQRVIGRHGGSVWAEGEVGTGATFYFTLDNKR